MTIASRNDPPVVVIGAGPVGLVAAAHLTDRGLPFLVLEPRLAELDLSQRVT